MPTCATASEAYSRYGPALLRKAERFLRNEDDALDLVQSLFADLIAKPPPSFDLPYLYRAVSSRCINTLRDRSNRARLLAREAKLAQAPCLSRSGEQALSLDLLSQLVDRLDKKSTQIFVSHFLDELTQEEVAVHLGMSRRAVVKRLQKIRGHLSALNNTPKTDATKTEQVQ